MWSYLAGYENYSLEQLCNCLIDDFSADLDAIDYLEDRAYSEAERGNAPEAKKHLLRLIDHFETYPVDDALSSLLANAYVAMGLVHQQQKDFHKSIMWFEKAVDIHDDYPGAYFLMAHSYWEMEDYENAIESWRAELNLAPMNTDSYFNIADAYQKLGSTLESIQIIEALIEYNPKGIRGLDRLLKYYKEAGNIQRVRQLRRQILKIDNPVDIRNVTLWVRYNVAAGYLERVIDFLQLHENQFPLVAMINLLKAYIFLIQEEDGKMKAELKHFKGKCKSEERFISYGFSNFAFVFGDEVAERLRDVLSGLEN